MPQAAPQPQEKSPVKQIDLDKEETSGNPFDDEDIF